MFDKLRFKIYQINQKYVNLTCFYLFGESVDIL